MSIKHFSKLPATRIESVMNGAVNLQFNEKIDGTGFSLLNHNSRFYTKRVGSPNLYPIDPKDGELQWGDSIWEQTFKSAHLFVTDLVKDFIGAYISGDFEIDFEILSSRTPNALEYLSYGSGVSALVLLRNDAPTFLARGFVSALIGWAYKGHTASTVCEIPYIQNSLDDELNLTQNEVRDKWVLLANPPLYSAPLAWRILADRSEGDYMVMDSLFRKWCSQQITKLEWPIDLKPFAIPAVPIEGVVVTAAQLDSRVSDDFTFKIVDADWFLSLTSHNYSFRKKLFKTPHKRSDSVADVHFRAMEAGAPKGDCDRLAIATIQSLYSEYLKSKHLFTPAVHDRNKEAVFTSLKSYGW